MIGHVLKDRTDALEAEKAALHREQQAGYYQSIALADRESLVGNPAPGRSAPRRLFGRVPELGVALPEACLALGAPYASGGGRSGLPRL